MIDEKLAERFAALFDGYSKAYGQFEPRKLNERQKMTGRSFTVKQPLGLGQFVEHLSGTGNGLGVVMLREDESCLFGAIDIDDPETDHADLETKVRLHNLPLVVCRSKSNGAHLYCFLKEPIAAPTLQRKLAEWCALLGYSNRTEIFPKQTARVNADDIGNWINLPYYGNGTRTAFHVGEPISLEQFLELAESRRVPVDELERVKYGRGKETDLYFEGPPCLQHLHGAGGFVIGTMRDGMFNIGVYLRKRYPDDWENHLSKYNVAMCTPPLRNEELQEIIKSLKKKSYGYKCKLPPIAEYCQRKACVSRKFGVGEDGPTAAGLEISAVTCYAIEDTDDPPMWGMEIGGRRILLDNDTFFNKDAFNKKCLATIRRVPILVSPSRWQAMVGELAANSDLVFTPKEASATGNLIEWIQGYLVGAKRTAMDQILTGGVFKEEGFYYFQIKDLFAFLDSRKIAYKSKPDIYHLLKEKFKATSTTQATAKGSFKVWKLPAALDGTHRTSVPTPPDFSQKTPF